MEAKYKSRLTKSVFITNVTKHKDGTLTASLQLVLYSRDDHPRTVATISSPTLTSARDTNKWGWNYPSLKNNTEKIVRVTIR